jgi:hypothetical protein
VKDSDQAFYDLIIKPFLSNKEAIKTICNLPDKKQLSKLSENKISDDKFLELLKDDYELLFTPLAKSKIDKWQKEKRSVDRLQAEKSQNNLRRIGEAIAHKGHQRPGVPWVLVAKTRDEVLAYLKNEMKIQDQPLQNWRTFLEEGFGQSLVNELIGEWEGDEKLFFMGIGLAQLADAITGVMYELSPEVVIKYRKKCKKLSLSSQEPAYIVKPL